jgi:hypothetical protein
MRLKIAMMLATGALAGAFMAGGAAHAQLGTLEKPVGVGVRAGGYFPGSRPGGMGKNWLALGADVRVNVSAVPIVGGQTVSLDYLKEGDSNITGITLVQRFSSPVAAPIGAGGMRPYFGLGFGYYRVHVETDTESETKSTLGMKIMGGVDIGKGLYVQGDYHLPATGKVAGLNPKGLAITAGLRF